MRGRAKQDVTGPEIGSAGATVGLVTEPRLPGGFGEQVTRWVAAALADRGERVGPADSVDRTGPALVVTRLGSHGAAPLPASATAAALAGRPVGVVIYGPRRFWTHDALQTIRDGLSTVGACLHEPLVVVDTATLRRPDGRPDRGSRTSVEVPADVVVQGLELRMLIDGLLGAEGAEATDGGTPPLVSATVPPRRAATVAGWLSGRMRGGAQRRTGADRRRPRP